MQTYLNVFKFMQCLERVRLSLNVGGGVGGAGNPMS